MKHVPIKPVCDASVQCMGVLCAGPAHRVASAVTPACTSNGCCIRPRYSYRPPMGLDTVGESSSHLHNLSCSSTPVALPRKTALGSLVSLAPALEGLPLNLLGFRL